MNMTNLAKRMACDYCSSSDIKALWEPHIAKNGSIQISASSNQKLQLGLSKCKNCNLKFATYKLNQAHLNKLYASSDEMLHASEFKNRYRSFLRAMSKSETIRSLQKASSNIRILDVGCAEGSFLYASRIMGFEAQGIEPSQQLTEWGIRNHKLSIVQESFDSFGYPEAPYQIISLWDVIEHVESPKLLIRTLVPKISSGGLLIINTPIVDSFHARVLGKRWPFYLNVHTFYLSRETLKNYCKEFELEFIESNKFSQTLSIGYLMSRYKLFKSMAPVMMKIPFRYMLGQETFIFRKR